MTDKFEVRYTDVARDDLLRLFEFVLEQARSAEDFEAAQLAVDAIQAAVEGHLSKTPFMYRKVDQSPFLRELVIPFRSAGHVALYEIERGQVVNVLAVRHQREDDYY